MERLQREFTSAQIRQGISIPSVVPAKGESAFKGGKANLCSSAAIVKRPRSGSGILDEFGWEVADMGSAEAARAIEPLCMLWCIHGLSANDWIHASSCHLFQRFAAPSSTGYPWSIQSALKFVRTYSARTCVKPICRINSRAGRILGQWSHGQHPQ